MADGYARASGKVGVASVHQGPGFTNALTGLTEAAKARTPLVVLAADIPVGTLWSNFKVDQGALAATLGAIPERVRGPQTAAADTARALDRAQTERRPVVLSIPFDVVEEDCPDDSTQTPHRPPLEPPVPSEGSVAAVADLLASSRRPAIVAGRGAALAGAREALETLGDRVGAVLATSAMAHGLFAGSPYSVGIAGGFSSSLAMRLLGEADLVLAFGASLNHWTVRHGGLFSSEARVVQVDLDAEAIGRVHRADVGVVGDAAGAARAIVDELERRGVSGEGFRSDGLEREISEGRTRDEPYEDLGTDRIHRPAHPDHRAGRPAPRGAHGLHRLGAFPRLPGDVPGSARPAGLRVPQRLPVGGAGARERHRGRDRAAGEALRRRRGRRRRPHGPGGAGDGRPLQAADARRRLQRRGLRRRGAPLRPHGTPGRARRASRRQTSPRSRGRRGPRASRSETKKTCRRFGTGWRDGTVRW